MAKKHTRKKHNPIQRAKKSRRSSKKFSMAKVVPKGWMKHKVMGVRTVYVAGGLAAAGVLAFAAWKLFGVSPERQAAIAALASKGNASPSEEEIAMVQEAMALKARAA